MNERTDYVDVLIDSSSGRMDGISQYPLLDGSKKYTVMLVELVSPLTLGSIPDTARQGENQVTDFLPWFEVRRKNVAAGVAPAHDNTRLTTLVGLNFAAYDVQFKKSSNRPVSTAGDIIYYLQRMFDDIKTKYINAAGGLVGLEHGGIPDVAILANTDWVSVGMTPSGHLRFLFSSLFTKHFFINVSSYAQTLFGIATGSDDGIIAFRTVGANVVTGRVALMGATINVIAGQSEQTVELRGNIPADRFLEHRIRLEVETQMPIPPSIVWSHNGKQQLNTVIGTFPIVHESQTRIKLNNAGISLPDFTYQTQLLTGDIVFRSSESNVREEYVIQNSQFFHNVRLELFIVRKEWFSDTKSFQPLRSKMVLSDGQSFTAKLRFQSI